jgi:hypothetical protein
VLACGLNDYMRPECIYPLKELASTHVALDGAERLNPAAGSPDARPPDTGGSPP